MSPIGIPDYNNNNNKQTSASAASSRALETETGHQQHQQQSRRSQQEQHQVDTRGQDREVGADKSADPLGSPSCERVLEGQGQSCTRSRRASACPTEKRRSERLLKKRFNDHNYNKSFEEDIQQAVMLSKIKPVNVGVAGRTRASSFSSSNQTSNKSAPAGAKSQAPASADDNDSDNEANQELDNDSNNNNLDSSKSHNENELKTEHSAPSKKSQDELMEIVDVSRKRRLSKDSADSLGSFIKWSFGHIAQQQQRRGSFSTFTKQHSIVIENNNNNNIKTRDADLLDDEDDWSTLNNNNLAHLNHNRSPNHKFQTVDQLLLLRQQAKLSGAFPGESSSANLAMLKSNQLQDSARFKRQRTQMYSPEGKPLASGQYQPAQSGANRKVSSYLGNVVDRLHQQHQKQQISPVHQQERQQLPADADAEQQESSTGLSFHLQQFLAQQTSLEDLCSSVGLDDSNQLVLAAAIHRALVDSVGPADSKSTASSTGGSSSSTTGSSAGNNLGGALASSGVSLHLADSLGSRNQTQVVGRRAYNTRGGGLAGLQTRQQLNGAGSAGANSTAATLAALNINSRVQQQRHAQAAAALSALASAGHNQQQVHQGSRQLLMTSRPTNVVSSGATAIGGLTGAGQLGGSLGATGNPMVDFECDTCGSSFDDRHRLMQHQSIHLELKKDWFKETPVDEVMKIFNRRRGEFLCNTCNLRFEATFDYDKHNHQVHGQRPYCCQFCGNGTRTFRFWRQYLNHLYDHRYIFSCTIDDCDFTVNRRDSLRFHIFRFHLNCQLPQQQTHIRSAGHHNMLLNDSKWPALDGDEEHEDHDDQDNDDLDDMHMGE